MATVENKGSAQEHKGGCYTATAFFYALSSWCGAASICCRILREHSIILVDSINNSNAITNYTSFDGLGNVLSSNQMIAGQTYSFTYTYNLAGSLQTETYPSGRTITTGYDTNNRPFLTTGALGVQQTSYNNANCILAAGSNLELLVRQQRGAGVYI